MSDVKTTPVNWLWDPYIPYGKITPVQGDPGDGKTTFVLAVASLLTNGNPMPESKTTEPPSPVTVIYQTAEDGLADTIKPRLEEVGADCSRVLVIDESKPRHHQQKVEIFYNCLGKIDIPDLAKIPQTEILIPTRKGVAISYSTTQKPA